MDLDTKIKSAMKVYPRLHGYEEELKALYTKPLPVIKGIEVKTLCNVNGAGKCYIWITDFPQIILPEVQLAAMNVVECLEPGKLEIWGAGEPTDAMKKYLEHYMQEFHVSLGYVPLGYHPRVISISWEDGNFGADGQAMVKGSSCDISLRTGLVVNIQKQ